MGVDEIQVIASIIGDLTITAMLAIGLIYVERRRIALENEIFDDWKDMKSARVRGFEHNADLRENLQSEEN